MINIARTLPFLLFTALLLTFSAQAQTVSGFDLGSVEVQVLGSEAKINQGQYAEIAKFRISNRTGRNLLFDSLRLRNYGTADLSESFESVRLTTTTGQVLGEVVETSRKYWTWQFPNQIQLSRGDSVIVSVRGRLIYAKRGETVQLGIRRDEDLALIDRSSGFGVRCSNCRGTRLKTQNLDTGGVYINRQSVYRASNYRGSNTQRFYSGSQYDNAYRNTRVLRTNTYRPTTSRAIATPRGNQKYSPGAKDVVFFSSTIRARNGVGVDGIFLQLGSGTFVGDKDGDGQTTTIDDIDAAFGDWRLLVNGVSEDTSSSLDTYNGQTGVLFNSSMQIPANAQIAMIGRVKNEATNGDKVRFALTGSGLIDPVYLYSGNSVQNINGAGTGNFANVR